MYRKEKMNLQKANSTSENVLLVQEEQGLDVGAAKEAR